MKPRKGEILELKATKMAYGGQAIAHLDGFVIFLRGAIPGDRVMARVVRKKRDYAEARVIELLESSADRIDAPCPYHGTCGGCQWQHMIYERQLEYKRTFIEEALAHISGLKSVTIHETIPSENRFGYRNKMEFSFSDRRWLLPHEMAEAEVNSDFALGLHVPGTFHKVIDIEACLLQRETGNLILREVKRYVKDCGTPVYGLKSHEGFWRFLTLRHSVSQDEWMVNLVTAEQRPEVITSLVEDLCRRIPGIRTIVNNVNRRKAGIAIGEEEIVLSGEGYLLEGIGPHQFQVSANSFFQTNTRGAEKLYKKVAEYSELTGSEIVLDLYSGTGTIPIFLSGMAKTVIGMEIAESAVSDARRNCMSNQVQNCDFILGDIRENLAGLKWKPDVLIIDPPRAGMHKDVLAAVLNLAPEKIVYVSCNPATLARDLGLLSKDYDAIEIQPVDMFPHTYHIEAVAKLNRRP
ncbi:23S rRNA (uracil(1939)-C(5))-methyltransferase RlmD [Thermodesulfobacteriota bacterium]